MDATPHLLVPGPTGLCPTPCRVCQVSVDPKDNDGATPLKQACWEGNAAVIRFLIDQGADVEARGDYGWTPLTVACQSGFSETVRLLVTHDHAIADCAPFFDGTADLSIASLLGNTHILCYLVEAADADISITSKSGLTSLARAQLKGKTTTMDFLIEQSYRKYPI